MANFYKRGISALHSTPQLALRLAEAGMRPVLARGDDALRELAAECEFLFGAGVGVPTDDTSTTDAQ